MASINSFFIIAQYTTQEYTKFSLFTGIDCTLSHTKLFVTKSFAMSQSFILCRFERSFNFIPNVLFFLIIFITFFLRFFEYIIRFLGWPGYAGFTGIRLASVAIGFANTRQIVYDTPGVALRLPRAPHIAPRWGADGDAPRGRIGYNLVITCYLLKYKDENSNIQSSQFAFL